MKVIATIVFFLLVLSAAAPARAGEFAQLKQKMIDARRTLYCMLDDVGKRGADQQKKVKDSAEAVSSMCADMKVPPEKADKFKELVATWKAFKKTREEELVPAILSGRQLEAEKIATGIQGQRFFKMMMLCEELDK